MSRRIWRLAGAGAIAVAWVSLTWLLLLAGQLMSLDEEWQGWGDLLRNPYAVIPYAVVTVAAALAVWRLGRTTRR